MITFTPDAQDVLDQYLVRVRSSLLGSSVDAEEVERDVREHIDVALAEVEGPVTAASLQPVLRRLGSPDQWGEDATWWRRTLARIAHGPEDWRLPYLCLGLTLLGVITFPLGGVVLIAGAWLLARATLQLVGESEVPLGPRRWLVYPPLVLGDVALLGALLLGPLAPGLLALLEEGTFEPLLGDLQAMSVGQQAWLMVGAGCLAGGVWWILLALVAGLAPRLVQAVFAPFGSWFRTRHALALAGLGGLVSIAALLVLRGVL